MNLTRKEGAKKGAILVEGMFFSKEEAERFNSEANKPGASFQIHGYLVEKKWWQWWQFWR